MPPKHIQGNLICIFILVPFWISLDVLEQKKSEKKNLSHYLNQCSCYKKINNDFWKQYFKSWKRYELLLSFSFLSRLQSIFGLLKQRYDQLTLSSSKSLISFLFARYKRDTVNEITRMSVCSSVLCISTLFMQSRFALNNALL